MAESLIRSTKSTAFERLVCDLTDEVCTWEQSSEQSWEFAVRVLRKLLASNEIGDAIVEVNKRRPKVKRLVRERAERDE